jgi:hypothetical protein
MRRFRGIKMGGKLVKDITLPDTLELDPDGNRLALTPRYIWKLQLSQFYTFPLLLPVSSAAFLSTLSTRQARGDLFLFPMQNHRELGGTLECLAVEVVTPNASRLAKLCVYSAVGELLWVTSAFGDTAGWKIFQTDSPIEIAGEYYWVGVLNQALAAETGPSLRSLRVQALAPRLGYDVISASGNLVAGVWEFGTWPDPPSTVSLYHLLSYPYDSTATVPLVFALAKVVPMAKSFYTPTE